jgi:hypothetical protein
LVVLHIGMISMFKTFSFELRLNNIFPNTLFKKKWLKVQLLQL